MGNGAFKARAHSVYAKLRKRQPVCQVRLSRRETAFLAFRYSDVSEILKDRAWQKIRQMP